MRNSRTVAHNFVQLRATELRLETLVRIENIHTRFQSYGQFTLVFLQQFSIEHLVSRYT